jgi:hypothetical protein
VSYSITTPTPKSPLSSTRSDQRRRPPFHQLIIRNIRDDCQLRSREQRLCDAGMLTLAEITAELGVSTGTIKIWHHAGLITGHPYNGKGQCLYPARLQPSAWAQGHKLSQQRPAAPADDV